jgi:hypothetical protein
LQKPTTLPATFTDTVAWLPLPPALLGVTVKNVVAVTDAVCAEPPFAENPPVGVGLAVHA